MNDVIKVSTLPNQDEDIEYLAFLIIETKTVDPKTGKTKIHRDTVDRDYLASEAEAIEWAKRKIDKEPDLIMEVHRITSKPLIRIESASRKED